MVFFPLHTFHFPHHRLLTAAFTHALSSPPRLLCLTLQSHTFPIQSAATLCVTGIKTNECIASRRCQSLRHVKGGGKKVSLWFLFFQLCDISIFFHRVHGSSWIISGLISSLEICDEESFSLLESPVPSHSFCVIHSPKMGLSSLAWPSILHLLY